MRHFYLHPHAPTTVKHQIIKPKPQHFELVTLPDHVTYPTWTWKQKDKDERALFHKKVKADPVLKTIKDIYQWGSPGGQWHDET